MKPGCGKALGPGLRSIAGLSSAECMNADPAVGEAAGPTGGLSDRIKMSPRFPWAWDLQTKSISRVRGSGDSGKGDSLTTQLSLGSLSTPASPGKTERSSSQAHRSESSLCHSHVRRKCRRGSAPPSLVDLAVHGLEFGGPGLCPAFGGFPQPTGTRSRTQQLSRWPLTGGLKTSLLMIGAGFERVVIPSLGPNHKAVPWEPPNSHTLPGGPRAHRTLLWTDPEEPEVSKGACNTVAGSW